MPASLNVSKRAAAFQVVPILKNIFGNYACSLELAKGYTEPVFLQAIHKVPENFLKLTMILM